MLSSSPTLFAANRVLHRLLPPRHPPSALRSLTIIWLGSVESRFDGLGSPLERERSLSTSSTIVLQARRSQLGKIFSYQRSMRDPKITSRLYWAGTPDGCRFACRSDLTKARLLRSNLPGPGGAGRDRTDDLRLAKPALSQLSYSPIRGRTQSRPVQENLEARSVRSDQFLVVDGSARSPRLRHAASWWAWVDSNHRPPAYQADALTT